MHNLKRKFTPAFGTKANEKRMKRIRKIFDYADKVYPQSPSNKELRRIRSRMNKRRPHTLTHDEADFVIGVCQDGGLNLKQQLKDLLKGYKPMRERKSNRDWKQLYERKMKEAIERHELERMKSTNQ